MAENLVAVTNPDPSNRPLVVSGTVTTNPSGTQNVAVTGQPISATISGQPVSTYSVANPALTGVYVFSAAGLPGVAAANTFLTLFNPAASGKTVTFSAAFISTVAGAAASTTAPMRGYRIAAAPTGGTVQAAATIAKFNSASANTVAEVRLGNPTVTLGAALWNTPPAVTTGAGGGQFVHVVDTPEGSPPFILAQGEGIAINCSAGDTDQVWNLTIVWAET